MNLTLTQEQYQALIYLARLGSVTPDQKRVLEKFLKDLEALNGYKRYLLLVQWQELNSPLPAGTDFPAVWPPEMRRTIEREDRPIAKSDVLKEVDTYAKNPTNILVTKDVGGIVGWTKIDDFFKS